MPSNAVFRSSLREAWFVWVVWIIACVYTVGFAWRFAYRSDADPGLIAGIPEWVVWGVIAPWIACTLVTCWFAFRGIKDEDLGEDAAELAHD
jgi:uncharacterized protein DUF997